jgi:hypothetical protein
MRTPLRSCRRPVSFMLADIRCIATFRADLDTASEREGLAGHGGNVVMSCTVDVPCSRCWVMHLKVFYCSHVYSLSREGCMIYECLFFGVGQTFFGALRRHNERSLGADSRFKLRHRSRLFADLSCGNSLVFPTWLLFVLLPRTSSLCPCIG